MRNNQISSLEIASSIPGGVISRFVTNQGCDTVFFGLHALSLSVHCDSVAIGSLGEILTNTFLSLSFPKVTLLDCKKNISIFVFAFTMIFISERKCHH